jgi:hypothetical protein
LSRGPANRRRLYVERQCEGICAVGSSSSTGRSLHKRGWSRIPAENPKHGAKIIGSVASWLRELEEGLGTYDYLGGTQQRVEDGSLEYLTMGYLLESQACVAGDPDDVIEIFKAYEATGCDIVFCLLNPYNIPHDKVMQTIELMGTKVIPAFK